MLKKLTLKNFRKLEDLELSFQSGIIVVRGANERGKSTAGEAIAYAFFGAKACRQPLEECVTWGKPVASLKVVLEFVVDGVDYTITRAKSGAELRYEGGVVTGQAEVTGFVERLLRAPAKLATSLWFVSQNSIRGALEAGAGATAQMIEQLADFELVDRIIELVQSNLPTGQARPYEERLKQAREHLDSFTEEVTPPGEFIAEWLGTSSAQLAEIRKEAKHAEEAYKAFDATHVRPLIDARDRAEALQQAVKQASANKGSKAAELATVPVQIFDEDAYSRCKEAAEKERAAETQQGLLMKAHSEFMALPKLEDAVWDGDAASFNAFVAAHMAGRQELDRSEASLKADLRVAQSKLITESACGLCGKDLSDVPEVVKKNEETHALIAKLQAELGRVDGRKRDVQQEAAAIAEIQKREAIYEKFCQKWQNLGAFEAHDVTVPKTIIWKAGDVNAPVRNTARTALATMEQARVAYQRASSQRELLQRQLDLAQKALEKVQGDLDAHLAAFPNLEARLEEHLHHSNVLTAAAVEAAEEVEKLEREIEETRTAYESQKRLYDLYKKNLDAARTMCEKAQAELEELNRNNALLKKIRASRPAIVDRLWTVVLSAVSYYFSQMRGSVQSSVARAEGGFTVDGKPTEGLSGSTLDILGLSIRLALLKTFLPNVSFLLLDEPAAACDDVRESALLGVISTSHFDQTILVTHSDLADAYANQMINL